MSGVRQDTPKATAMKKSSQIQSVGTGLQVMQALVEADVTTLAGPKGKHDADRSAPRPRVRVGDPLAGGGCRGPARVCRPD